MTQRQSHQRFPNSKQNTPLTCFLAHRQTKTSGLVPLMTPEKPKHTHTVGPLGHISVKALSSSRGMCFGFSTTTK